MLRSMTADGDTGVEGDKLNLPEINGSCSGKRTVHNQIEKKRKDRLKEDIEDIRKLIPDSNFMIKKLTHHEVMRAACEYICSLQQQNNELLMGKKDEVSVSVIEKLRKENNELKSENKKFREIIENADFPPLADLSQLILSWKPRSSPIISSSKTCSTEPAMSSITVEKKQKKKQGLTVAECLKRKSESITNIKTTASFFGVEYEKVDEKVIDTTIVADLQLQSAELSSSSAKEVVTLELKQCSANKHRDPATPSQNTSDHSIASVHETNGQVIHMSNDDFEESICLSELIASDNQPTGLKSTDSTEACTAAAEKPNIQTMLPQMATSDFDKQCTESLEDEIRETMSQVKLAINTSDIIPADAVKLPASSVKFEQGMLLDAHGKVETSPQRENVCPVSCVNTSCASLSNVVPDNVSSTIDPTICSLHPLRVISLNTSSNSFLPQF